MAFPDLHPALLRALTARNYTDPTPVQEAVLRPNTLDRDLLVSAQTGSGKTVAYGVALGNMLLGDEERFGQAKQPLALIVAPTRELAQQVQRELQWLFAETDARIISCVGGMDIRREQYLLSQGAHIVVGTPGRLADHLDQRRLNLSAIRVVVLDEADEMLDLGFREELEALLKATPEERRTLLFSATLPKDILALAKNYQRNALRLALSSEHEPHGDIEYRAFPIRPKDVEHAVVNSLRYFDVPGALVFCSTRESVRHLHANLEERGFSAVALSGELKQSDRNRALQSLRDGRARVCVATDVAARGLDMPDLGLVIHADLPQNRQALLHRSGRTGRAGRKGMSLLLVPAPKRRVAESLLSSAKIKAVWSPAPSADAIRQRDEENLIQDIVTLAESPAEDDLAVARTLLADRNAEQLVSVLVRLRRDQLPAPEVIEEPPAPPKEIWGNKKKFAGGKFKGAGFKEKNFKGANFKAKKFGDKQFGEKQAAGTSSERKPPFGGHDTPPQKPGKKFGKQFGEKKSEEKSFGKPPFGGHDKPPESVWKKFAKRKSR